MPAQSDADARSIDGVFRALADPTRRHVLERLGRSPASVSELAKPFDMALPSFMEHLKILEGYGLVRSGKTGQREQVSYRKVQVSASQDFPG